MPVKKILQEMTSADIAECMAFDQLKNEKYREAMQAEMMTSEQREEQLMMMLGYRE